MNDRKFFLLVIALENATTNQLKNLQDEINSKIAKYTSNGIITDQFALTREINKIIDNYYDVFVESLYESANKVGERAVERALYEMIPVLNKAGLYSEAIKLYQETRDYADRVAKRLMVDNWSGKPLSYTIKTLKAGTQKTVQNIIVNGSAQGKSAFDIALDIEQYLIPVKNGAYVAPYDEYRKRFGRPKTYKVKGIPMGSVQYNAYRIARTEMAHISRQATLDFYKDKEWIKGYTWNLSNRHPVKDECDINSKKIYKTEDEIPAQHPNCLCDIRPLQMTLAELKEYRQQKDLDEEVVQRAIKISKQLTKV